LYGFFFFGPGGFGGGPPLTGFGGPGNCGLAVGIADGGGSVAPGVPEALSPGGGASPAGFADAGPASLGVAALVAAAGDADAAADPAVATLAGPDTRRSTTIARIAQSSIANPATTATPSERRRSGTPSGAALLSTTVK
jgi:hypothetical protein